MKRNEAEAYKGCIIEKNNTYRYFDKHGVELHDGDVIRWDSGKTEMVYATENGFLGTDATNPKWIELGRAVPCEYGCYPLENSDLAEIEKV